jgi:two-component system OmpR family sensor kinase
VLGLVVIGWLATIGLGALILAHEMNDMFDDELAALVEATVLSLDASVGQAIPRHMGVQTRTGERILRILPGSGPMPPAPWPELQEDGLHDAPGWRILRVTSDETVIEAAHATAWRRDEITETASAFLFPVVPLIALLLWGLRRTTAEATSPVSRLAAAVAARKPDDFSPLEAGDLPQELHPLAGAFGDYLLRIKAFRQAERDFVANAAHDLRTPLAVIRGRLQLSADPDAAATVPVIDGMTRRLERLLQLSRLEAGASLGQGPADLVRILRLLMDDLRPRSRHRLVLDDSDLETLMIAADPDAVAILLSNLLENAVDHGSGEVRLRLRGDGTLTVENPSAANTLAAGRFEKGDGSSGLGLGISIIEAVARAMNAPLTRQIGQGRVTVELRFPLAV